jgi:catechol 2,3-dioxygenase-like lactoylglutathione lyase family enzyme
MLTPSFICPDVRVRNLARAVRFYRGLGLRPVAKGRMDDGTSLVWLRDPKTRQLLELFQLSSRSPLYTPLGRRNRVENALIFSLPDVQRLLPRLRRFGARVLTEFEDGEVHLTFVRDPDGTLLEFLSWTDEARKSHRGSPLVRLALPPPNPRVRRRAASRPRR